MPIINREQLMDHIEGDLELLEDLHEIFNEECDALLIQLRTAVGDRDFEAIAGQAHTMKGMLSNFQAESACQIAHQIEQIEKPEDIPLATQLLEQLSEQIQSIKSEIQQIIQLGST